MRHTPNRAVRGVGARIVVSSVNAEPVALPLAKVKKRWTLAASRSIKRHARRVAERHRGAPPAERRSPSG